MHCTHVQTRAHTVRPSRPSSLQSVQPRHLTPLASACILQTSTRPPQKPSTPSSSIIDTRSRTKDSPNPNEKAGAKKGRTVHFPPILEDSSSPESMRASQPMPASQVTNGQKPTVYDSAYKIYVTLCDPHAPHIYVMPVQRYLHRLFIHLFLIFLSKQILLRMSFDRNP